MSEEDFNPSPTTRFTGLASTYARFRPDYPAEAVEAIVAHLGLTDQSVLVDVGSGTGISSRLFAERKIHVIGIEPNDDMRTQAQRDCAPERFPRLEYREGAAEKTGLPNEIADAVLCAQAFHWFRQDECLMEFRRILKPGGWVALMWNERDSAYAFTQEYGELLQSLRDTKSVEVQRAVAGQALLDSNLFVEKNVFTYAHAQTLSEDGLIGRALSASYAPRAGVERDQFMESLRMLFRRFQTDNSVVLRYTTSIYVGQRPES